MCKDMSNNTLKTLIVVIFCDYFQINKLTFTTYINLDIFLYFYYFQHRFCLSKYNTEDIEIVTKQI